MHTNFNVHRNNKAQKCILNKQNQLLNSCSRFKVENTILYLRSKIHSSVIEHVGLNGLKNLTDNVLVRTKTFHSLYELCVICP